MTRVKICGITSVADALLACEAGADYLGFVLSESPRRVGYETLADILLAVADQAHSVGVFASEADLRQFGALAKVKLDYFQTYFPADGRGAALPRLSWIDSLWITEEMTSLPLSGGLILADFKNVSRDKMTRLLTGLDGQLQRQIMLAGNLDIESVGSVVRQYRPFAVDVARGTEKKPGVKDEQLLRQFISEVKRASN